MAGNGGGGTVILTATNGYSGGTTINAGTLNFGNSVALGTGLITFGGNATLQAGTSATLNNNVAINSAELPPRSIPNPTWSRWRSHQRFGRPDPANNGTPTSAVSNSYGGSTTLSGGTLVAGADFALGKGILNRAPALDLPGTAAVQLNTTSGSQTVAGLQVFVNNVGTNTITVGSGKLLRSMETSPSERTFPPVRPPRRPT